MQMGKSETEQCCDKTKGIEMEKIFVKIDNGYVTILDEKGNSHGYHLSGNDWVNVQVNGDKIMATNKGGYSYIFDSHGNLVRKV